MKLARNFIIGIDEVGRGALAGPVVVVAARVPVSASGASKWQVASKKTERLRDSKQLSARQREAWFAKFKTDPNISYAVAFVYPREIERRNISGAANLAAFRACSKLVRHSRLSRLAEAPAKRASLVSSVFLDGGLYLKSRKLQPAYAKTVIKGDEAIPAISIASIIAKVTRDRAMARLAKRYPAYGLEVHKGYGTLAHRKAIKKHGSSEIHRKTFTGAV